MLVHVGVCVCVKTSMGIIRSRVWESDIVYESSNRWGARCGYDAHSTRTQHPICFVCATYKKHALVPGTQVNAVSDIPALQP